MVYTTPSMAYTPLSSYNIIEAAWACFKTYLL
jgi:hypothetical protein